MFDQHGPKFCYEHNSKIPVYLPELQQAKQKVLKLIQVSHKVTTEFPNQTFPIWS